MTTVSAPTNAAPIGGLVLHDASTIPDEPPPEIIYKHRVRMVDSVLNLWRHREIIYTLAERDFPGPVQAGHPRGPVGGAQPGGYAGHLRRRLLPGEVVRQRGRALSALRLRRASSAGASSPRRSGPAGSRCSATRPCWPRPSSRASAFLWRPWASNALSTVISWIPLTILFIIFGRAPTMATLWVPAVHGHRGGLRRRSHPGHRRHHHPDARPRADASHPHLARACSPPRSSGRSPRSRPTSTSLADTRAQGGARDNGVATSRPRPLGGGDLSSTCRWSTGSSTRWAR